MKCRVVKGMKGVIGYIRVLYVIRSVTTNTLDVQ